MRAYGVTLEQVFKAVKAANIDVGAKTIEINRVEYFIRGIGWYSYGNYKLEPRDDDDFFLSVPPNDLGITKNGPSFALPGDTLAYTIQVQNPLLVAAENVVLTDTFPLSTTFVSQRSSASPETSSPVVLSMMG